MNYLWFIPILLALLCIYLELRVRLAYRRFIDVRTGKPIPVEGGYFATLWLVLRLRYISVSEVVKESGLKLGPYYANNSIAPGVTFCDPEDVKTILKRIDDFPKDTSGFDRLSYIKPLLGFKSVVGVNNPEWHDQRSLLNKAFVSNGIFFQPMVKKINTCLSKWENQGDKVCIGSDFQKLTLDVLASCIFGLDFDTLNGKFSGPLESYNYSLEKAFHPIRLIFPFTTKIPFKSNLEMIKHINIFDKYCWQIMDDTKKKMEEKKKAVEKNEVIINDQDECQAKSLIEMMFENNLPEETIRDNLSVFFIAGHETTSNSLAWIIATIASNQEVQQKARQEILENIPGEVTFDSLKELPYIDGLLKECMRKFPPLGVLNGRKAVKDSVIGHCRIPAGTNVDVNFISMANNPKIWGDPDVIRPERWFTENITKEQRNAWMPFSGGPRICIGMNFSLMEQKIFLINFLKRFQQVKLAPNSIITPKMGGLNTYSPDTEKIILQLEKQVI